MLINDNFKQTSFILIYFNYIKYNCTHSSTYTTIRRKDNTYKCYIKVNIT